MDYENAKLHLNALISFYNIKAKEDLNEAQTRFHLIDALFFNCLDWEKSECEVEEALDRKFADYTFRYPHRCLIVEAKREGHYFELPAGWDRSEYKIESLVKENSKIGDAIKQAMEYCQSRGVQIGAVCNGFQIIIFLASRNDGIAPLEGNAIVFDSIESMLNNFLLFWNYLSKIGIQQKKLIQRLSGKEIHVLPKKLSSKIDNYPGYKIRNELQTNLQILSEVVLEDVVQSDEIEEEFVKYTYCSSGALSQYALISKEILEKRSTLLFNKSEGISLFPASSKKGVNADKIFAESLSKRPILLIGDVGSGKSMFIKYLKNIEAAETLRNAFTLVIDLGSKAALQNNLNTFILNEIKKIFLAKYSIDFEERNFVRGVYHLDIEKFSKGIYSDLKQIDEKEFKKKEIEYIENLIKDQTEHIRRCFEHLVKGRQKQVVLFIDNIDQRREIEIQEQAFLIANEITSNWMATVFLTLRPATFFTSKKIGSLTGYHPKAFTIAPPRVDDVILKRLDFSIQIASGFLPLQSKLKGMQLDLKTLKQFLEILHNSFSINTELKEFIDNISGGNIRLAIEFLAVFVGSGHIDTYKILQRDNDNVGTHSNQRYIISLHEFIRSIIYKENQYFNSESTEIVNLFDISTAEGKEHFLQILLIDYFLRYQTLAQAEGFHPIKKIIEYLQNLGFNISQIEFALTRLNNKKLIESESREEIVLETSLPEYFRITTTGAYHISRLIDMFIYIDAIVVDTPILNESFRERIKNVFPIQDRIERGKIFIQYLNKKWEESGIKISGFDWKDHSNMISKNMIDISTRMK